MVWSITQALERAHDLFAELFFLVVVGVFGRVLDDRFEDRVGRHVVERHRA